MSGRLLAGQVKAVEATLGPRRANLFFWEGPLQRPTWSDVQARCELLYDRADSDPAHSDLAHFVTTSLDRTNDPMVVLGLARLPLTRRVVREWLCGARRERSEAFDDRLSRSRVLGAAFAGAAKLTLESPGREELVARFEGLYQIPDSRFYQFLDSLGLRLQPTSAPGAEQPGWTSRNRLIIVEHLTDVDAVALLLPGAARTTLFATSDTFGRADLSRFAAWPDVGEIVVEHLRSRIPRFSAAYVDLHEVTSGLAKRIVEAIGSVPGVVHADLEPILEVAVADFLFFQALKLRAIEELLADRTIDHIIVAVDDLGRSRDFLRMISSTNGLLDDPRVEIVSVSRSGPVRERFWTLIDELSAPTAPPSRSYSRIPTSLVLEKIDQDAERMAESLAPLESGRRPSVLVATSANDSYNEATAGYVRALQADFDVRVLCTGGDVSSLSERIDELDVPTMDRLAPFGARFNPLADDLVPSLRELPLDPPTSQAEAAAAHVLAYSTVRLVREAVGPTILAARTVHLWLAMAERAGALPEAIVLTPQRTAWVGLVAPVARRFGIPTLAVEPHAQDANYSRYVKVGADYYGVMSEYFRTQTAASFGIDPDRIRVIGSPRQVAPPGYDPVEAQRIARREFTGATGFRFSSDTTYLVFFCQPSAWDHVAKVWEIILRAAAATESIVLLKTHPEEPIGRIRQYLDHADMVGLSHIVTLLDTEPATAVALGDLVVTKYSTGAFDAAIRQRPVVCVTEGDVPYPVDLPAILDVPLAGSVEELSAIIVAFRSRPGEYRERVRRFIERESQFVEGPGPRLRDFLTDIIAAGSAAVRGGDAVPDSLFLDGPHPIFEV